MDLFDAVIGRLTYRYTPAEDEARRRPPYPEPPRVQECDRVIMAAQAALPDIPEDAGPIVAGTNQPLGRAGWLRRKHPSAPLLIAAGALSLADAEKLAAKAERWESLEIGEQIVLNHLHAGDVDAALAVVATMGEMQHRAYRDIGRHHARRGDATAFFGLWKRYATTIDRHEMVRLKELLIEGIGSAHGWEEAARTCGEKRIGPTFLRFAFQSVADAGQVEELLRLSAGPAKEVLEEADQLTLLVRAVGRDSPGDPEQDHPRLAEVLDRVIALDFTRDKATMRLRDHLLLSLWASFGEQASLDRARKAARAPRTRTEMGKLLPRDLTASLRARRDHQR